MSPRLPRREKYKRTRWTKQPSRAPYVREYGPNVIIRGYLSPRALDELERYGGNTVERGPGYWIINPTPSEPMCATEQALEVA